MQDTQDIKGYTTIEHIANYVVFHKKIDDRFYEGILQYVIDGYVELNATGIIPSLKVAHLTVNEQNTVSLPNDYMGYSGIGIENNGRMWTFTRNRNILLPANMTCGVWDRQTVETNTNANGQLAVGGFSENPALENNGYPSGGYTQGGGFNIAYYRIDERRRMIVFLNQESVSGLTIVLEYYSTGVNGNTIIPRDAKQALVAYAIMMIDLHASDVADVTKEREVRLWRSERDKLYSRTHAFTSDEFLDEFYEELSQGVKR